MAKYIFYKPTSWGCQSGLAENERVGGVYACGSLSECMVVSSERLGLVMYGHSKAGVDGFMISLDEALVVFRAFNDIFG